MSRPELAHVRTRYRSPQTNGVIERFFESLKYEHLFRLEIATGVALADELASFENLYNQVRPHEALEFYTPMSAYLAPPAPAPPAADRTFEPAADRTSEPNL